MYVIVWREVMFVYLLVVLPGYPARDNWTANDNESENLKIFSELSLCREAKDMIMKFVLGRDVQGGKEWKSKGWVLDLRSRR